MELRWFSECSQLCGDCVTDPDHIDCPEVPYIKAMSVLRQATKGTPDALMDKLLLEFLTEADLELQNTSTNRSRQKLYIAMMTALIDYLHIRNMPHAVLSDFHTELINRASGFQGQFSFDAEIGRKSQTLEDATRQALVLAYYEAFQKDRKTTYALAKKYLGLNRAHFNALRMLVKAQTNDPRLIIYGNGQSSGFKIRILIKVSFFQMIKLGNLSVFSP